MSTSADDFSIKLVTAITNCKPSERNFLEGCKSYYERNGKLSDKQAKVFHIIYRRIARGLKQQRILKRQK